MRQGQCLPTDNYIGKFNYSLHTRVVLALKQLSTEYREDMMIFQPIKGNVVCLLNLWPWMT
jgi:hypothetical protein